LAGTKEPWRCRTQLSALLAQARMCLATWAIFRARSPKPIFWAGRTGLTMRVLLRWPRTRREAAGMKRGDHSLQIIGAQGGHGMLPAKVASALDFAVQALHRWRHGSQRGIGRMARFLATAGTYQENSWTCTVLLSAHRTCMHQPSERARYALARHRLNHRSRCWATMSNDAVTKELMRSKRFPTMQVLSQAKRQKISSAKAGGLPIGRQPWNLARRDRRQQHVDGGHPQQGVLHHLSVVPVAATNGQALHQLQRAAVVLVVHLAVRGACVQCVGQ